MFWTLALRNVLRNKRRTGATVMAIALSCGAMLLFGGYVTWAHLASETHGTSMTGNLQLFKTGYRAKGAGNPAAYAIEDFESIKMLLQNDMIIGPRLAFATGQLVIQGMASYAAKDTSTPFLGIGAVPEDLDRMAHWNPHGLYDMRRIKANAALFASGPELDAADVDGITLGVRLAGILDLQMPSEPAAGRPSVELISQPPAGGLVNMITASVRKVSVRPLEELDNRLVFMPLPLASDMLFPGEPVRVTSIILVLKDIGDLPLVEARLAELAQAGRLPLEWRNCWDINPNNVRSIRVIDLFFQFAFSIIAVVLVFTIYNTMMMSVMERVREIGTIRAMGVSRPDIARLFAAEGLLLGLSGGVLGVVLALVVSATLNRMEILYVPPMVSVHAKLEVFVTSAPWFMAGSVVSCIMVALLGAWFPARRASRLEISDALRQ